MIIIEKLGFILFTMLILFFNERPDYFTFQSVLKLRNLTVADSGVFKCTATNTVAESHATVKVIVNRE